jgi:hypothetical protein
VHAIVRYVAVLYSNSNTHSDPNKYARWSPYLGCALDQQSDDGVGDIRIISEF